MNCAHSASCVWKVTVTRLLEELLEKHSEVTRLVNVPTEVILDGEADSLALDSTKLPCLHSILADPRPFSSAKLVGTWIVKENAANRSRVVLRFMGLDYSFVVTRPRCLQQQNAASVL